MPSVIPAITELERIYDVVAQEVDHQRSTAQWLPQSRSLHGYPPVITIAGRGRKSEDVNGWYTPHVWTSTADDVMDILAGETKRQRKRYGEITLAGEFLQGLTEESLMTEVCRQMAVHLAALHGRLLVNSMGRYSAAFNSYASLFGLTFRVGKNPNRGFYEVEYKTKYFDTLTKLAGPDMAAFDMARYGLPRLKARTAMRKWSCGCTIVRCAVLLEASCVKCGRPFLYADKDKDTWQHSPTVDEYRKGRR